MDSKPTILVFQCNNWPLYGARCCLRVVRQQEMFQLCHSLPGVGRNPKDRHSRPDCMEFLRSASRSNPTASVKSTLVIAATSAVLKMVGDVVIPRVALAQRPLGPLA